jgi:hypothetical protein
MEIGKALLQIFQDPALHAGDPYFPDEPNYNSEIMTHARLYQIEGYYDVQGMRETVLSKLLAALPLAPLDTKITRTAIRFLMAKTPYTDTRVRIAIVGIITNDMDWFGVREVAKYMLETYPVLNIYCLHGTHHGDGLGAFGRSSRAGLAG